MNGIPGGKPLGLDDGELEPLLLDELPREEDDDERAVEAVLIFEYIAVNAD